MSTHDPVTYDFVGKGRLYGPLRWKGMTAQERREVMAKPQYFSLAKTDPDRAFLHLARKVGGFDRARELVAEWTRPIV